MKSVNGGLEFNDSFFCVYLENPAPIRAVVGYFEFSTKTIKGKDIRDTTIVKVYRCVAKIRLCSCC